jgi:hypothetical protein
MYGSKMTVWWHDFVNGLKVSDETKATLHAAGPTAIWVAAAAVLVGVVVLFAGC